MKLNFPDYRLQIKSEKNKNYVFDLIRKKYVVLTPEEWVRQHIIHHLIALGYPLGLMSVERKLPNSTRRYDLVVYNRNSEASLIVECKSPETQLGENITDQISLYLLKLPVQYFLLSNGLEHHFYERKEDALLKFQQIPKFSTLNH